MNRSSKRRRKALAKQVRQNRRQISSLVSASDEKTLHRFAVNEGMLVTAHVLYSDEEAE